MPFVIDDILIILAVSAAVGAVAGSAMVVSSAISADAQQEVAETNARATVQSAKEAANAQIEAAKQDSMARMHESNTAFKQEMEYLKQEKWYAIHEADDMAEYQRSMAAVDAIDIQYIDERPWGTGAEASYDYGLG